MTSPTSSCRRVAPLITIALALGACGSGGDTTDAPDDTTVFEDAPTDETVGTSDANSADVAGTPDDPADGTADDEPAAATTDGGSAFLGDYVLADDAFGTMTEVTVTDGVRTISTNALPDHETGEFPNSANPNAISAQDQTWAFPAEPTFTNVATEVRVTGVAVNGVKFEPGTAETATCASGEVHRIEGLQDTFLLGMDDNNAHVQPTGEYHYHGIADVLVEAKATGDDLVLIGFAVDGHLMYHSLSDAYSSSYQLSAAPRTGTDCVVSGPGGVTLDLAGTSPDGTYTSDFVYVEGSGDLDECNGMTINGSYAYLVTDDYPFVGRCVKGDVSGVAGVAGGGAPGAAPEAGAGEDVGAPPDAPDLTEAAESLGIGVDELTAALGRPPSVENAAATLGVTVDELRAVLPPPPTGTPGQG